LNEVIIHYIWEIVCAIIFALALTFLFNMYFSASNNNKTAQSRISNGQNIKEVLMDNIEDGQTILGSDVYYEILRLHNEQPDVIIDINGNVITDDMFTDYGTSEDLLLVLDMKDIYRKQITKAADTNIKQISYRN